MKIRKLLVLFVALAAFVFVLSPASAAWGAHWGSGSAIAFGSVTGLKKADKSGASIQSVVSHPGARFCKKVQGDDDDCSDRDHDEKDYSGTFSAMHTPSPANTPGIVFCQNVDYPNVVVQGTKFVNLTVNFTGNAFIPPSAINNKGEAQFQIHSQVDVTTLNHQFNASDVCPSSMPEGSDHEDDMPETPHWTIVDFVARQFSASLQAFDSKGHILTQAVFDCQLPADKLKKLKFHEFKEYSCSVRFNR